MQFLFFFCKMSHYDFITSFRDAMNELYAAASVDHEKQLSINITFTQLVLENFKDVIFSFRNNSIDINSSSYMFSYKFVVTNSKDGSLLNIDYSKIPYYLQLSNRVEKRCIRMFVSPLDISKIYVGCYIGYEVSGEERLAKNTYGPLEQIADLESFNNTSLFFSLGDFLIGRTDYVYYNPIEISTHSKMH